MEIRFFLAVRRIFSAVVAHIFFHGSAARVIRNAPEINAAAERVREYPLMEITAGEARHPFRSRGERLRFLRGRALGRFRGSTSGT
jgi:hypothetical protein